MILNLNSQIIWVFVDLLILFVLMKKFLFGPITQMLDDRAQQVSDTLDQADKRLAEAEQQQTAHAAQLASAKQEAAQIIEDARARGQQEYDRLVAEAQTAVQRLDEQAARRRESERRRCSVRRKGDCRSRSADHRQGIPAEAEQRHRPRHD
ncbi:MAG: F0F1 ATP synthase subunit B [Butyricicoccus sp.]